MQKFIYFFYFAMSILLSSCSKAFMDEVKEVISLNIRISNNTHTEGILLEWEPRWEFANYAILRRTAQEKSFSNPTPNIIQSQWLDNTTIAGVDYYYIVEAYSSEGKVVGRSKMYKGRRAYTPFNQVAAPSAGQATIDTYNDKIALTWTGVPTGTYKIYRREETQSAWVSLAQVSGISYLDQDIIPGTVYIYKITALGIENGKIKETASTPEFKGSAFSAPIGVQASNPNSTDPALQEASYNNLGKILISWQEVLGASYYEVYRSSTKDGTYEKVTEFATQPKFLDIPPDIKGTGSGSSFKYPSYFYKVVSIKNKKPSSMSDSAEGQAINPQDILTINDFNINLNTVTYPYTLDLSWSAASGNPANIEYILEYDNKIIAQIPGTDARTYIRENEPLNNSVYYNIYAINKFANNLRGKKKSFSYYSAVPAPIKSYGISKETDIALTVWKQEQKITISSNSGKASDIITWQKTLPNEAVKYNIYRSSSPDKGFNKVATALTEEKYKATVLNEKFYYKVFTEYLGTEAPENLTPVFTAPIIFAAPEITQITIKKMGLEIPPLIIGDRQINIEWKAINNAKEYKITWSTSVNDTPTSTTLPKNSSSYTLKLSDAGIKTTSFASLNIQITALFNDNGTIIEGNPQIFKFQKEY